jgi:hypothetical protein
VFPVRYELGFYISENGNLHSNHRENLNLTMYSYDLMFRADLILPVTLRPQGRFGLEKK